jgi:hypothetical protein
MGEMTWLCADYHFPALYSIRAPLSSMSSARALPAPSPSTVRLALVRTGIELFGIDAIREVFFPVIRAMSVAIRPPERVAISTQRLRAYKVTKSKDKETNQFVETIVYREYVHAQGVMSIYVDIPTDHRSAFVELFQAIGYWGQAHSLTQCVAVTKRAPEFTECLTPLRSLSDMHRLQSLVISLASEFRSPDLQWHEILPIVSEQPNDPLMIELYVWPMVVIEQRGRNRLLLRRSI